MLGLPLRQERKADLYESMKHESDRVLPLMKKLNTHESRSHSYFRKLDNLKAPTNSHYVTVSVSERGRKVQSPKPAKQRKLRNQRSLSYISI